MTKGCDEAFPELIQVGRLSQKPKVFDYTSSLKKRHFVEEKNSSRDPCVAGHVHTSYNAYMSQAGLGEWQEDMVVMLQRERKGYLAADPEQSEWSTRLRVRLAWVVILMAFAMVSARVVYLHTFEAHQQLLLSDNNHIEQVTLTARRGRILDRTGVVLAESVESSQSAWVRQYPLGAAGSSVIGYLSEVVESELGCTDGICYRPGGMIGRTGMERALEQVLKGDDGGMINEVDAMGTVVRPRGRNESEPGQDITLTLDAGLQLAMYRALDEYRVEDEPIRGAAVAMSLQGEVLGLVSYPSYDPADINRYLRDTSEQYFLNRAISGTYPPGSVFKMVTGYAGLRDQVIDANTEIEDTGEIRIGEYSYATWNYDRTGTREGHLNLVRALARSNDIYFYKLGEMVGIGDLVWMARQFGVGEETGIELPSEAAGLLPDPLWKERRTGERWFLGNTYHFAIGQGDILMTPLQVARMSAAVVSGRLCVAHLDSSRDPDCDDLGLATEDIAIVREGMRVACAPGGTAFTFFDFEPYVLCKTGTAQHSGQREEGDLPHAWITVAYPGENPEMILTILVESGGEGSAVAGAIARRILDEWKVSNN